MRLVVLPTFELKPKMTSEPATPLLKSDVFIPNSVLKLPPELRTSSADDVGRTFAPTVALPCTTMLLAVFIAPLAGPVHCADALTATAESAMTERTFMTFIYLLLLSLVGTEIVINDWNANDRLFGSRIPF